MSCGSNEDIVRIKEKLMIRAEKTEKKLLQPEVQNLVTLKKIIDDYVKGKSPTIKLVMLNDFAIELGIIIEKYRDDTFKENSENEIEIIQQEEYVKESLE
jgi:hypothetical protein